MATVSYTVHLSFAAPSLTGTFERHSSLTRDGFIARSGSLARDGFIARSESFQIRGAGGMLSAVVKVHSADGASEAGLRATLVAEREWRRHGSGGPLQRLSWRAHPERVAAGLFGRRRRSGGGGEIQWNFTGPDDDRPDDGGTAGVREPRRPKPAPPSMGMALPLD